MPDKPNSLEIRPDSVYTHSPDILTSPVQDGMAMMDVQSGNYYGLDDIGIKVWDMLDGTRPLSSVCQELTSKYDVSPQDCWSDVSSLIAELAQNKLVIQIPQG